MPTRPSASPLYATDSTLASGPESGQPTRLNPGAGILAQGLLAGVKLTARVLSHVLGTHGDWVDYLDQKTLPLSALNWPERATYTNGSTLDASIPIAWDPLPSTQGDNANTGIFMVTTTDTKSITSDDGTLWRNEVSFGGTLGVAAYDLAVGQSSGVRAFLASGLGNTNLIRTVDAGTTWTLAASGIPSSSALCNGAGEVWVACGAFGAIQRSTDGGLTWSAAGVTISGWGLGAKRIVWNGSLFVMIAGSALNKIASSPDGLTWTVHTLSSTQTWVGLAYSATEDLWMAISDGGAITTSANGTTWSTVVSVANAVAKDLAVIGSLWVAPTRSGDFGGIAYSVDRGVTWTNVAVGNHRVASGWCRIIAADKRFVVVHATGTVLEFALSLRTN
jgi:hypothetical protein